MSVKTWRSPAKVNLFLSVGPPDTVGYHPLRTVFQAIGLYDELTVDWDNPEGGDHWEVSGAELPADNTLTKTLRYLREYVPVPPVRLSLVKRIPAESGLGGGSGNAGTLLRAVRERMPDLLEERFMFEVARAVGADVAFFLVGGCARAEGYGERLTPLEDWPNRHWAVVVRPSEGQMTGEAYRALDGRKRDWRSFPEDLSAPWQEWMFNDFSAVASCASSDWEERLLVHGAEAALLSGSGSACFGVFESEETAQQAAQRLRAEHAPFVVVAPFLTRQEALWTP